MNRYYLIFDTTKEYSSIYHAQYIQQHINEDILGNVIAFANRNNTSIEDIRLFAFATKKAYDESYKAWARQVKF